MSSKTTIQRQRGAALIVSLIILVAMTLIGVTSMKSSSTELTMAGNLRESALTFQAAEVGLGTAEAVLQAGNEPANMIDELTMDPDYFAKATWQGPNATTAAVSLIGISTNPSYIVKSLGTWDPDRNVSSLDPGFGGYGQTSSAITMSYYRLTARGFGQTGTTSRTLQSFFGRRN